MQGAVWLITGAQASGKSTVAELLAQKFERGVHVRGGQFHRWAVRGWVHFDDPERAEEARRLLDLRFTPNNAHCIQGVSRPRAETSPTLSAATPSTAR